MGNLLLSSKPPPLPMHIVLKRLNELAIPDDKLAILDYIEMLDIAITHPKTGPAGMIFFKELQAMKHLLKIMKKMLDGMLSIVCPRDLTCVPDPEIIFVCMQIFEAIKTNTPLVMDFIQFGGLDLLEKAMRTHAKDDFISVTAPKLFSILSTIGAGVSRSEIENEGLNLQLCQRCQETIERTKKKDFFQACVVIPRSSDRANRVLKFMDNYLPRVDVQIVGLDAVINFVRNSDGKEQTRETNLVDVLGRVLKAHTESPEVVWRVCMTLTVVVSFNGELANDVANLQAHDTLIDVYETYVTKPFIQQQILWLLASFLEWPKSKRVIHKSEKCMQFFKDLTKTLDFSMVVEQAMTKENKLAQQLKLVPGGGGGGGGRPVSPKRPGSAKSSGPGGRSSKVDAASVKSAATGKASPKAAAGAAGAAAKRKDSKAGKTDAKDGKGKIAPETPAVEEPEYERKEFDLVIPLRIRTFLRETRGIRMPDAPTEKEKKVFKQRRNFDERPKFGTVDQRHFTDGSGGLIPQGQEDEDGQKARVIPDWEKRLNYGEEAPEVDKKKKKKKPAA